jgi:hypothetical protein
MYPIRKIFWKKFSGSLDLGLTYYKSSEMLQLNFGANIDYRTRKDNVTLTVGGIYSNQFEDDTLSITRKYDVGIDYSRNLKGRWEIGTGVKAQQNSELNLNYRFQVGLVTGYNVVHTNRVRFIITGGLMGNREEPIDSAFFETSLEGVVGAKVTWFQYKHPKIKIFSGINFYPSITISQRFRLEYALTVKYEIFNNFDLGVTLYDNYDTKPAGGGPALNDWGTVVSIGYTF